ncbi:MAG: glycosyltransferase [Lachnospiraceae bacterium]|nr:glycosyltransferase [Lachnospiraceae bacterium]
MTPLVSICILTYNHEKYVAQMLDSMLSQKTDFGFEILMHDDASTDRTADIIKGYAQKYPEIIKPLFEEENQFSKSEIKNISGIYNFPRVQGKYIAMCEGDDYWTDDNKLAVQTEYMEAHPDCSLCFHSAHRINIDVAGSKLMRPYDRTRTVSPEDIIDKSSGYPTASLLMRADLMKILPDFYMKAPIGDIPMQLTMAAGGYGYYIDRPMCAYRYFAPGSWSRDMLNGSGYIDKQNKYLHQMLEMYDSFNEFSDYRFASSVESAKKRIAFGNAVNIRDWKSIFSDKNRAFLKELPFKDRTYLWLQKTMKKTRV